MNIMNTHYQQLLLDYMLSKGINQDELANELKVKPPTLSNWLNSKHGITEKNRAKIEKLCSKILEERAIAYRTLEDTLILAYLSHPKNIAVRGQLLAQAATQELTKT